jgi:glycosyltransferase involved in cell wall biosynthesis/GR25 family glycosyltransferase involved in LPS biosynthesis
MACILYCGDNGVETGFGRVAQYLIPALAEHHDVHALSVNWHGDPDPMQKHCKMYPAMAHGSDPFGSHRIGELLQIIKPDLVWVTNDIWCAINLWEAAKPFQEALGFKWFVYTPIDSYGLFPELLPALEEWDGIATYTRFGAEEIRKIGYKDKIRVVGHGTDFSKFFRLDQAECRKELGVPEDVFIVFNGNRNQPRKRIDLTIKGFIKFAKDKPDARLWLNMGKKDMGWDLVPLFKRVARDEGYDATGKLILTSPHFSTSNCLPIEQLNKVYNAVDIGVNTCIGEGWGLVNTEHAATGVAQLVPDHTSLKEIFHGVPRIACHGSETDRNYGLERPLPEPDSMAELLTSYYNNRMALKQAGDWCYQRVHEQELSWSSIQKQMLNIVKELLVTAKKSAAKGFAKKPKGQGTTSFPGQQTQWIDFSEGSNVFCISIEGDERRKKFADQMGKIEQGFNWWAAVDGRQLSRKELEAQSPIPIDWEIDDDKDTLKRTGEAALILSSIALWKHAFDQGMDHLVILEDDTEVMRPLVLEVPEDADLVFFNDRSMRNKDGLTWGYVCGTDGYLITRQGLSKLLKVFSRAYLPLDLQMIANTESMRDYEHHLFAYRKEDLPLLKSYTLPPIAFHNNSPSRIR